MNAEVPSLIAVWMAYYNTRKLEKTAHLTTAIGVVIDHLIIYPVWLNWKQ